MNKNPLIAIDFGTSNCCIGVFINEKVEIIPNDYGEKFTPSYITFTETDIFIGNSSKDQKTRYPTTTIFNIKKLIGRKFEDIEVQENMKYLPFNIIKDEINEKIKISITIKGEKKEFYIEEICAMIFNKLKQLASNYLNKNIRDVIIVIPTYFNDLQRQIIKDSVTIAGLNLLRLYNDTICASIYFGLNKNFQKEQNIISLNLGSGNLSISLIKIEDGIYEEIAVNGNINFGGDDFDNRLIDFCAEEFKKKYSIDFKENKKALIRVKIECEKAKILLSSSNEAIIEVESLIDNKDLNIKITRQKFEELCIDLFNKCIQPLTNILKDSKCTKNEIDEIILSGGSTNIPKFINIIQEFFNGKIPKKLINYRESITYGASVIGSILTNITKVYEKIIILNVSPFSLGIEDKNRKMNVIIPRNSTFPTKKTINFKDDQLFDVIKIYEGENELVEYNNLLNAFRCDGMPLISKVKYEIAITFDLDINENLTFTFFEKSTGYNSSKIINNKGKLSINELDILSKKIENLNLDIIKNKEKNEENHSDEKELRNGNDICFLEKEITRLKKENKILKDKNEKYTKIFEYDKIKKNAYKNEIKILNNKFDALNQKINQINQEELNLKLELDELNIKYQTKKKSIEEKIKRKNQEFNEINRDLSELIQQKKMLENEYL